MIRNFIINNLLDIQDPQISSSSGEMGMEYNELLVGISLIRSRRNLVIQQPVVSSTTHTSTPLGPPINTNEQLQIATVSSSINSPE